MLDRYLDACKVLADGEGRVIPAAVDLHVKVESAETGAAFALCEYVMPPGGYKGPPPHIHRSGSETFYVLDGTLEMLTGTETIKATAGACVHVPAGAVHTFTNPGPGAVRFLQIVSPGSLLTMIEEVSALIHAGVEDQDEIAAAFRRHDTEVVG